MQTKCPTKRKDNYDSLNPTARPPRYHPFSRCFPTDFTAAFWQSSHLSVTLTHMHANDRGVSSIQWRHCKKKKKSVSTRILENCRIHDKPLKMRDQDLCFWCHRVRRVKYPPVDKPYGPGRLSWVYMCGSKHHASPSADFSLSRNK